MSSAKKTAALKRLALLYRRMDAAYAACADALGLNCRGCQDNCCEGVFRHHTYVEWLALADGLFALPQARQEAIRQGAEDWLRLHQNPILPGVTPRIPCPLAEATPEGLACGLYDARPMVCRLHGVPTMLLKPGGGRAEFPGCHRAQDLAKAAPPAPLDRTPLLTELARLEMDLLGRERMARLPRVDLTIAEMLLLGRPKI